MSTPSSSPPLTPGQPRTPPPGSPAVRITLPTPPSFSQRKSQMLRTLSRDSAGSAHSSEEADGPADLAHPGTEPEGWKKGHGRSVSFSLPTPFTASSEGTLSSAPLEVSPRSSTKYTIPQRKDSPTGESKVRRAPPRPLNLARGALGVVAGSKTSVPASRWGNTAAARGLSLNPAALAKRHSTSGAGGSIWSAFPAGLGESSGWISPALASARSALGSARTRGLTVAVMQEQGKEMLIETLPTPGLPSAASDSVSAGKPGKSPTLREVILCRYYHTPGLSCTSRPCRFVHSLEALNLDGAPGDYAMRSPRTAALPSARPALAQRHETGNRADPTHGTFAAHQTESRMKTLSIKDVDEKGVEPGERVVVAGENGCEIPGVVFLMSGGGKGAVGKSKAKYKTEPCRDFATGTCPYGEYCSFLHDESPEPPKSALPNLGSPKAPSAENKARRKSFDPTINAWKAGPPASLSLRAEHVAAAAALVADESKLSAFAAPYLEKPLEVDTYGRLVPPRTGLSAPTTEQQTTPVIVAPASGNAWAPSLAKSSIPQQTLQVPVSAASWLGTDSDPATPWDPALRAQRHADAEAAQREYRNDEYPPSATYAAPTYPWGMPMTPHDPNAGFDPAPGADAGVMWTPAGWAVQDAAMKMALMHAEAHKRGEAKVRARNYWRTKKCKFYEEGTCPHGDQCTYAKPTHTPSRERERKKDDAKHRTQPCKFFNSASGCLNGDACDFLHELVVPGSVPLVDRPRPWRTRPCRHFQTGRCHLGNACHFAHVYERPHAPAQGGKEGGEVELTEERLEMAMREMKSMQRARRKSGEESEEDDVEIITEDMSLVSRSGSTVV